MKRIVVGIAVIFLAALPIPTRCYAQYRPPRIIIRPQPPPPPSPEGRRYVEMDYPTPAKRAANLAELLNLTDDQKQKVQAIFVEQEKEALAVWADDTLTADARAKKVADLRAQATKKVRDLLTDDQKKKYDEIGTTAKSSVPDKRDPRVP